MQTGFRGIFVGIPHHSKGYLVYVTSTRNIISSYDVVFDEMFLIALAYTTQPYSEYMAMQPSMIYITYDKSSKEQTGNITTFTQFEEGNLLSETRDNAEIIDKSDDNSIMPPLLSEEEIYAMDHGDESDDEPMSTEILEDIHDGSQYSPNVNGLHMMLFLMKCFLLR